MNLNAVNRSVTLLTRMFDAQKPTQAFLPTTAGKPVFSENAAPFFTRTAPGEVGVSAAAVASFLKQLDTDPALHMHSVMILHKGRVICDAVFGAQDLRIPKYTFSACKSIVSLCIGILVGDGVLSLSDKLTELFPERVNAVSKLRLSGMCVRDLLTMRSGIIFNELECQTEEDWIKGFLNSAVSGEIGVTFSYNSLNTYMLAAIICKKTGKTLTDFVKERLFVPLSITDFFWETCPRGIEKGGWGLYLRPEDMAKLGLLVLHEGRWSDRAASGWSLSDDMCIDTHSQTCNVSQIVPSAYIRDAVTAQTATPRDCGDFDYGYQIWVGRESFGHAYLFNGMLGQNVLLFPDTDTVLVSYAGNDEFFQTTPYYRMARDTFSTPASAAFTGVPDTDAAYLPQTLLSIREHTKAETDALCTASDAQTAAPPAASPIPQPPRFFLVSIRQLFRNGKNAPQPESGPTAPPPTVLPVEAAPFLDRIFTVPESPMKNNAVGLLPMVLQTVHNAYSSGFLSLSLSRIVSDGCTQLLITYREKEDTHVFPAGIPGEKSVRSTCTFRGVPFRIAASCRFAQDENARPVCILHIDFLETPCSRIVKLFLNPTPHTDATPDAILRQEEAPGADMIASVLISQKGQFAAQPIIGGALDIIDDDYLSYRTRRIFAPEIGLSLR